MSGRHLLPWSLVAVAVLSMTSLHQCYARLLRPESDAKRLYDDKLRFSGYNKLIRPVGNTSDTLTVRIGLRLTQIIDVVSWLCSSSSCFLFASHSKSQLGLLSLPGSVKCVSGISATALLGFAKATSETVQHTLQLWDDATLRCVNVISSAKLWCSFQQFPLTLSSDLIYQYFPHGVFTHANLALYNLHATRHVINTSWFSTQPSLWI